MTRRLATIPAPLAIAVSLAACGASASPATHSRAASTSASASTKNRARVRGGTSSAAQARARAFASAVNLGAADVPGFTVSHEAHKVASAAEARLEGELHGCVGFSASASPLARASSPELDQRGAEARQSVSSAVTVEASSASATAVLSAFRSGRLRACLARYFAKLLARNRPSGARIGPVSVKHGTPPAAGMSGAFALRFSATITIDRLPVPFYVDVLGFVDRSATVSLLSTSIPEAFPARLEERLFSLLLERARRHSV